ncbi:uncharacterized protein [Branchiostoma lanceolatum]|uniref:uncharacterized protein n=1 Tax=Branchiostoma lanceolatum TaxID=7740 RepID=UPI003453BA31
MVSLSDEQLHVCSLAEDYNIFVSGRAGSGKSVVVRQIITNMVAKYGEEGVAVLAPTGKAALLINGRTVHSFFGLGVGQREAGAVYQQLDTESVMRIGRLKVFICDEVSMLSASVFSKVDCLLKLVKRSHLPFGGVRLVLAGDFFQLPPIDRRDDHTPDYCFLNESWLNSVDICVFLSGVFRQDNAQYLEMLDNLRLGRRTPACLDLIAKLTRPLPKVAVRLYSLRQDMEVYNQQKLDSMEGVETRFAAQDLGRDTAMLDKLCQVPSILSLKIGAPVVLLRNLFHVSPRLVNGLGGVVKGFSNNKPMVTFETGETYIMEQQMFGHYDNRRLLAARFQFPLQLGFSMTVHKSQGSTLRNVEIVDFSMFAPGQQYTAYTRPTSPDMVRVLPGYVKHAMKPHPYVLRFYESSVHTLHDLVAPRVSKSLLCEPVVERQSCSNTVERCGRSDSEETFDHIIVPEEYSVNSILHLLREDVKPICPNLFDSAVKLDSNKDVVKSMVGYLIFQVDEMFSEGKKADKAKGTDVVPRKAFTTHISKLGSIENHQETKGRWSQVISQTDIPTDIACDLLSKLTRQIYKYVANILDPISEVAKKVEEDLYQVQPDTSHFDMSKANCGKVRYLMGWAIYRVLDNLESKLKSLLRQRCYGKKARENEAKIAEYRQMKALCCTTRADQITLQDNSRFPFSLEHLDRKNRGGLFLVNDNMFLFGLSLESLCGKLFKVDVIDILGGEATKTLSNIVLKNQVLKSLFVKYLVDDHTPDVYISLSHTPMPAESLPEEGGTGPGSIDIETGRGSMDGETLSEEGGSGPGSIEMETGRGSMDRETLSEEGGSGPVSIEMETGRGSMDRETLSEEGGTGPVSIEMETGRGSMDRETLSEEGGSGPGSIEMETGRGSMDRETLSEEGGSDPVSMEMETGRGSMDRETLSEEGGSDPVSMEMETGRGSMDRETLSEEGGTGPVSIEMETGRGSMDRETLSEEGGSGPVSIEMETGRGSMDRETLSEEGGSDPVSMEMETGHGSMDSETLSEEGGSGPVSMEMETGRGSMDRETLSEEGGSDPVSIEMETGRGSMDRETLSEEGGSGPVSIEMETGRGSMDRETLSEEGGSGSVSMEEKLFDLIAGKYLNMRNKEFARKVSESVNTQKETALRPSLQAKSKKASPLTFELFLDDKTDRKDFTHLHLKSLAVKGTDSFAMFTAVQMRLLLVCYGKVMKNNSKKDIINALCEQLRSNDHMLYPQYLTKSYFEMMKKGDLVPQFGLQSGHLNQTVEGSQNRDTTRQRAQRFCPTEDQSRILKDDHLNGNSAHLHQTRANQFGVLLSQIKRWHQTFKKKNSNNVDSQN